MSRLRPALWNPNVMSPDRLAKLHRSVAEFGVVENLVVRPQVDSYEVISGNQRLAVYLELGLSTAPCVVVELSDAQARLLAQVLNRTRGDDDIGLKAALLRELRQQLDLDELAGYLPEDQGQLESVASVGTTSLEEAFTRWTEREADPLHTLTFVLQNEHLEIVSQALEKAQGQVKGQASTTRSLRSAALVHLCGQFIAEEGGKSPNATIQ